MNVVALAGGVGAGKFLRGLVRAVRPENVTVVVNTGDDIEVHGLHVAPDVDSVMYWLAGAMDRERGWGRAGETFRATEELRRLGAEGAWFGLGDLDLATHLLRTSWVRAGLGLAEVTRELCARFGVRARVLPMTEDPAPTTVEIADQGGEAIQVHFQEYWVERGGRDEVKAVRYGGTAARPGPGVLEAIAEADTIVLPPSNPIASIAPILAVPGIRKAVAARKDRVVGVSGIVGGAPLAGMADKLLPVAGVEVSAAGVAGYYRDLLAAWVIDRADEGLAARVEALGMGVGVTDTIMANDLRAEALARYALSLL
ncbi:MAG: 2-phospho-L-lactate transferase [Actinomycetota bacterium]|nr:2-phospho-L-lactate transferase [Actinomycetota bacterium]